MAKPKRRILAVLAAAAMLTAMAGCDSGNSQDSQGTANQNSVSDSSTAGADESSQADNKPDDSSSQPTQGGDASSQPTGSEVDPGEESSQPAQSGTTPTESSQPPAQSSTAATESSQPAQSSTVPEESSQSTESSEVKEIKYIYLKETTAQYSGSGIMVNGNTVTITKGGTYVISGTLNDGSIQVLTDDKKVYLELDNAHVTNSQGAALNVQQAKRITVTTLAGTTNSFTDGGTHEEDRGAIFTNDTIDLQGEGTLNITANYAHGIRSDDDIILTSGTVNITSTKSGFHCNDGIEINGGKLFCNAGTNGIKTEGYINITGGHSVFIGGNREEKGAIHCDGVFTYTGGTFYAIGNLCAIPDASTSTANVVAVEFTNLYGPNRAVNITADGNPVLCMTSPNNFRYVVYGGAGLTASGEYSVSAGGTISGSTTNYVASASDYSGGSDYYTFSAAGTVTFVTVAN